MSDTIELYGHKWKSGVATRLEIDLLAFREFHCEEAFWHAAELLWQAKDSKRRFDRDPWTERQISAALTNKFLGVSGCANSRKTTTFAVYAILSWLCDPENTKVLVTSTSLKESKKRIWGSIREFYMGTALSLPGKLIDSFGKIILKKTESARAGDMNGIELIAGDQSKEKEAVGKIIGIKAKRVIVIADELPELSPAILEACYGNLIVNPGFQLIGLGNFNSLYDPFGTFTTPVGGWSKFHLGLDEWETECYGQRGKCIRFDGMKSPNVEANAYLWEGMYGPNELKAHIAMGENSAAFWRMCRSAPSPGGDSYTIFSEAELLRGRVHEDITWLYPPTPIAFNDPAFTTDGDGCVVALGYYGQCADGKWRIKFDRNVTIHEDISLVGQPVNFQFAEGVVKVCKEHKVKPENFGLDVSGGVAYADIVVSKWSTEILRVNFGGSPSELQISETDERIGKEGYYNRVSEIWYGCLEFVRSDQIRGLPTEAAREMKERKYKSIKGASGLIIKVEPKKEMKLRLGKSPDNADAACGLVIVARERLGALPGGLNLEKPNATRANWKDVAREADSVYDTDVIGTLW